MWLTSLTHNFFYEWLMQSQAIMSFLLEQGDNKMANHNFE